MLEYYNKLYCISIKNNNIPTNYYKRFMDADHPVPSNVFIIEKYNMSCCPKENYDKIYRYRSST